MRYIILVLLVLSLFVVACADKEETVGREESEVPNVARPPSAGDDGGLIGDTTVDEDGSADEIDQTMDSINIDEW